eukprot:m.609 g.609  ORF g.609 m.609 type:complete len:72 (-) comp572_c0_seq1:111-326(-)
MHDAQPGKTWSIAEQLNMVMCTFSVVYWIFVVYSVEGRVMACHWIVALSYFCVLKGNTLLNVYEKRKIFYG